MKVIVIFMARENLLFIKVRSRVRLHLVVGVLLIFGGGAINDFALIMLLGILIGTYSSVFVATPVMILVHQWQQKKAAEQKALAAKEANA